MYCSPCYHRWFIEAGWYPYLRVQLAHEDDYSSTSLDRDLYIKKIDNIDFFKQCSQFTKISNKFGCAENFLKFGRGFGLCKNKQIIREIYSDYCGKKYIEIGIFTHPQYQRQGIATQLASYFVKDCLQRDKTPIWSCNTENLGSLRTAFKAGFNIDKYYII